MSLVVAVGHCTIAARDANQDFVGMATPTGPELLSKGVALAIADGVSASIDGREAAEYCVRGLLTDYFATPDTWDVGHALDVVLQAINRWLLAQAASRKPAGAALATTLTAVIIRGRHFHVAHVGDSRAYLYRAGRLRRLTEDHVWDHPGMQHVLRRAMGLDARLSIDYAMDEVAAGDVFLLATDGVWASLPDASIAERLAAVAKGTLEPQAVAERLVDAARVTGSADDASAAIARVDEVPAGGLRDALAAARWLPLPARLKAAERIDGLVVEELLHESDATLIYRVHDPASGARFALKTLARDDGADPAERTALAYEEWIVRRLTARFFPQPVKRAPGAQNWLYLLTTWHPGASLQARLEAGQHFAIPDAVDLGARAARAAGALHRRGIVHRDIKPANLHLGEDGELRLIDFGLAQSGADDAFERSRAPRAGTPSFLAPEQFAGAGASAQTDLYAVAVTLYYALTRRYPYGEIEPFQTPRFGEPVPATRFRPDVPPWLDNLLLKAVAREPKERFETAEEMLLALERGAAHPLPAPRRQPLAARDPLRFWRVVAAAALLANLVLLYLLLG